VVYLDAMKSKAHADTWAISQGKETFPMTISKSKPQTESRQLSLFESPIDNTPLPERIALHYGFPLQKQGELYAVQDWIVGVAQTKDASHFWKQIKKRYPELGTACSLLPYIAKNGKKYKMDFADAETLYIITANMGKNTGIRQQIVTYMAKAGVKIDEYIRDPSQMLADAKNRFDNDLLHEQMRDGGIRSRKEFVGALRDYVETEVFGRDVAIATNTIYKGLFSRNARQLREDLGLSDNESIRDHITTIAIHYLGLVESISAERLKNYKDNDLIPFDVAIELIEAVVNPIGLSAERVAAYLGIDLVTGRKMITNESS